MNAANESALLSQTHHDRMEWDQLRENLSTMTIPETAENLAQEAFRYFSVCQKIVPGFAKAMSGMALYHISRKSYADAIEISKRLLQSSAAVTRRFEAHTNLSVSYYLSENYAQSYFHAQEALRLSPENPAALNNLAIASVLCGDEKTAYAIFDQAEKEDASARELRDRFQQALRCLGNSPLDRFIRSKPKLREDLLSKFPRTFSPVLTTQQNREEV